MVLLFHSFIHSTHLLTQQKVLITCYTLGIVLDTGGIAVNKTDKVLTLKEYILNQQENI